MCVLGHSSSRPELGSSASRSSTPRTLEKEPNTTTTQQQPTTFHHNPTIAQRPTTQQPTIVTATYLTELRQPLTTFLREVLSRPQLNLNTNRQLQLLGRTQIQRALQLMPCGNLELTITANIIDARTRNLIQDLEFRQNIPLINGEQGLYACRIPLHIRVPQRDDNTYQVRDVTAEAGPERRLRRATVLQPRELVPLPDREIEGIRRQQQGAEPTYWRLNPAGLSEPVVLSQRQQRERSRSRDRR